MEIVERGEGEIIPEGESVTVTPCARYHYRRTGDKIICTRFPTGPDASGAKRVIEVTEWQLPTD